MLKKFISGAMSAAMLASSVGSSIIPNVTAADTPTMPKHCRNLCSSTSASRQVLCPSGTELSGVQIPP